MCGRRTEKDTKPFATYRVQRSTKQQSQNTNSIYLALCENGATTDDRRLNRRQEENNTTPADYTYTTEIFAQTIS
jgi:hypothetical protein